MLLMSRKKKPTTDGNLLCAPSSPYECFVCDAIYIRLNALLTWYVGSAITRKVIFI